MRLPSCARRRCGRDRTAALRRARDHGGAPGASARRRALRRKPGDATLAAQVETAESYGVHFVRFEAGGADSGLLRRRSVSARPRALGVAPDAERVRAALGLTDPSVASIRSIGPGTALTLVEVADERSLDERGPGEAPGRRTGARASRVSVSDGRALQAALSYYAARARGLVALAQGRRALRPGAGSSSRTARRSPAGIASRTTKRRCTWRRCAGPTSQGSPRRRSPSRSGFDVGDRRPAGRARRACACKREHAQPKAMPAFEHCTYARGVAIIRARRPARGGRDDGRRSRWWGGASSWSFARRPRLGGRHADAPRAIDPEIGYVELAGFSPDGTHLLVVREARESGPLGSPNTLAPWVQKAFQVVTTADLHVEKQAASGGELAPTFRRSGRPRSGRGGPWPLR